MNEYARYIAAAVPVLARGASQLNASTITNSPMISGSHSGATTSSIAGDCATTNAVRPVTARPANIHRYTRAMKTLADSCASTADGVAETSPVTAPGVSQAMFVLSL